MINGKNAEIIRKNILAAKKASAFYDAILAGQLEETVNLAPGNLKWTEAARLFSAATDEPLLSEAFAGFCILISKAGKISFPKQPEDKTPKCISCMDSPYCLDALEKFAPYIDAAAEISPDFNSVCEAVHTGQSTHCILPIYNTKDGIMLTFYRLLQKYELKIAASSKVLMNDAQTEIELALLSKELVSPPCPDKMIISLTPECGSILINLMWVLSRVFCGIDIITTLPLEYTNDRHENIIILSVKNTDFTALQCFLSNAVPDIITEGIYININ